ncbi:MAG: bifunctional ornithine acetyltransferase/N-acetylglutamate synthase [Deltaproteobacteria bacterium]|nr:MAG: bifunctional ornithine acetyltransferase/N-acetylglutamate synthase [Deltaproteobacteria bacterium]
MDGCQGFTAAGIRAGIKGNNEKDLGLILCDRPATVAGVFTQNRFAASSVDWTRERCAAGTARALVVNSGNANCCTGPEGAAHTRQMASLAADALGLAPEAVLVASTGVIGLPLPVERIEAGMASLVAALDATAGFDAFSRAIMTTDTTPKQVTASVEVDGKTVTVVGVAKGSGMIRPNMATLLGFLCTDAAIAPDVLKPLLKSVVDKTFNRISVDGDTSTNDMVVVMANGASGVCVDETSETFSALLENVCRQLSQQIVRDGEGATKFVTVHVKGAKTREDAFRVADTVAHSNLVKTALFGEDANWGRIVAAAGRSGVMLDPNRLDVWFDDVLLFSNGTGRTLEVEAAASAVLKKAAFTLMLDLNMGTVEEILWTCDFSVDYVKINADYRS